MAYLSVENLEKAFGGTRVLPGCELPAAGG